MAAQQLQEGNGKETGDKASDQGNSLGIECSAEAYVRQREKNEVGFERPCAQPDAEEADGTAVNGHRERLHDRRALR